MMLIYRSPDEISSTVKRWKSAGESVAFVPTMGNLHEGHLALCKKAKQLADHVVVSIFVNPLQFAEGEDFSTYPRTLDEDCRKLTEVGVGLLFTPEDKSIYPTGKKASTLVDVPVVSTWLCGESRPGHFAGVTTVVAKLLNIVQPDVVIFGRKDFQQLFLIKQMVKDLFMPVEIVGVDTVRDPDGLAKSSRNQYLTASERTQAPLLYRSLNEVAQKLSNGVTDYRAIERSAEQFLSENGINTDYFSIRNAESLTIAEHGDSTELVVLAAVYLGQARLIDNIVVSLQKL